MAGHLHTGHGHEAQPVARPAIPNPRIEGLDGVWEGLAERNGAKLRQLLRIATGERGTSVQFDSPDQLVNGLPVKDLVVEKHKVRFSIGRGLASFEGTLSEDGTQLSGAWTSTGQPAIPVTFKRSQGAASRQSPRRPQTPKAPFPYRDEDVAFRNPAFAQIRLAGTLTYRRARAPSLPRS